MYPLGILFGLGFDTATEVALLFLAAGAAGAGLPWYAILCLPVLFAAGMSLLDTIDGSFMNFAYGWAFSKPVRKVYYNLTITALSVAVALIIGTIELLSIAAEKLSLDGGFWDWVAGIDLNAVGYIVVGALRRDVGGGARGLALRAPGGALGAAGLVARARVARPRARRPGTMARCALPLRHRRHAAAEGLRGARAGGARGDGRRLRADRAPRRRRCRRPGAPTSRSRASSRCWAGSSAERFDDGRDDFRVAGVRGLRAPVPPTTSAPTSRPAMRRGARGARGARRRAPGRADRQPRADRPSQARARRARALLRARPGRLRLRPRGPHRAAGHRPRPRRRLPARADRDHRRHAARHRLRARRRACAASRSPPARTRPPSWRTPTSCSRARTTCSTCSVLRLRRWRATSQPR